MEYAVNFFLSWYSVKFAMKRYCDLCLKQPLFLVLPFHMSYVFVSHSAAFVKI